MKKLALTIIIVTALAIIYQRYGYLLQSARNQPPSSPINDTSPLALTPQQSDDQLKYLSLPSGFVITYFATDVPGARSLTLGKNGIVYVGTRSQGAVYALEDIDHDGRADNRYVVASRLNNPNGVAYQDGNLYVAEINRLIVFRNIDNTYKTNPSFEVVYDQLPSETHHGWRYLKLGPDNKLYLGIGAPCNSCERNDPFASLSRLNLDGTGFEVIARGVRNTVGFAWDPNNVLWFTDNGRDSLGDNVPPDELNLLKAPDEHYGFPYCHGSNVLDPQFGKGKNCADYFKPALELGPHVAALGLHFYQGSQFPTEYQNKVIIAEHGSWNRTTPIGYRLMTADINGNVASNYQEFVTGWLDNNGDAKGRPVDLLELPDGSLLISDDFQGAVYRLSYSGN